MPALSTAPLLAVLGNRAPAFATPLPVGQLNFPGWDDYEHQFRALFKRQYYTNQGPLVEELEALLADRLGTRHAICITNATLGLIMAAEALKISGPVVLPSFTFIASAQSVQWAGLDPLFCDIDPDTHHLDPAKLEELLVHQRVGAVMAVNLWGGSCNPTQLSNICGRYGVPIYFDSAHAFGCNTSGGPIGSFGRAEVFSFHATKVLSAGEGGCITTNDDELAERLRNIRSSYGIRHPVEVFRTANGRMSEAQAAMALMGLKDFDQIVTRNRAQHETYRQQLAGLPGFQVLVPQGVENSNFQYLVCQVDTQLFGLDREQLHQSLRAENVLARRYFSPGAHRCPPFSALGAHMPATDTVCGRILQLPLGARVNLEDVGRICDLLHDCHRYAGLIRDKLGKTP